MLLVPGSSDTRGQGAGDSAVRDAERTRVALSIAGSDSGGGAGVQADLKAFAACGVHGTCAITAVTVQDTMAVHAVHPLPAEIVFAQARAVVRDIGVDAVKVGMLASAPVADAVAEVLEELPEALPVVVDPVMLASTGARLLDESAQAILLSRILPRASVLTPNLPEARALVRMATGGEDDGRAEAMVARDLLVEIGALGPRAVVLTGGHSEEPVDLFWQAARPDDVVEITGERARPGADHGSGCTHSAVLAAELAKGATRLHAAQRARELTGWAIASGLLGVGLGNGPVDVLARVRRESREL